MRPSTCFSILAIAAGIVEAGRSLKHVGKKDVLPGKLKQAYSAPNKNKRAESSLNPRFLTDTTEKFVVNGSAIPDVNFDIGESYAGLLPISSDPKDENQLYFWFFPSENPAATDEILIWLNGGPGCSSLEGFLQENGPFLWQYGTLAPVKNPYTWINLTNVVWVEQPVGTGFSQGTPSATSEVDVAEQFLGFFKNFVNTFALQGRKVYITGESYAGYYVPYIADAMLNKNDTTYYNLEATMIYDPSTTYDVIANQVPAVQLVDYNPSLFPFNDTYMEFIHNISDSCGYTKYWQDYLVFPPSGPQPPPTELPGTDAEGVTTNDCEVFNNIFNAALVINPCFDIYQIATTCPILYDVLGFPGSIPYLPEGGSIYFNRSDVQAAMNAPEGTNWEECADGVFINDTDNSVPSGSFGGVLPGVIERSARTIIAHASLDMVLIANGTMLMIQNMTWGGEMGFQSKPVEPFYVPYHDDPNLSTIAGSGVMGTTHTERGLTWVGVDLSGHMVPQYAPTAAYRHVEFLLGRIDSLSSMVPFTTDVYPQPNATQWPLGNGTAPPYKKRAVGKSRVFG